MHEEEKHVLVSPFSFRVAYHSATGSAIITTIYAISLVQSDDIPQSGHRLEAQAELLHTAR